MKFFCSNDICDSSSTKLRRMHSSHQKKERWPGSASHQPSHSPTGEPQNFIEHIIKPKETLAGLALHYRCSASSHILFICYIYEPSIYPQFCNRCLTLKWPTISRKRQSSLLEGLSKSQSKGIPPSQRWRLLPEVKFQQSSLTWTVLHLQLWVQAPQSTWSSWTRIWSVSKKRLECTISIATPNFRPVSPQAQDDERVAMTAMEMTVACLGLTFSVWLSSYCLPARYFISSILSSTCTSWPQRKIWLYPILQRIPWRWLRIIMTVVRFPHTFWMETVLTIRIDISPMCLCIETVHNF